MRNPAELIFSMTRKTGKPLRWRDFLRAWGVYSVLSRGCRFDKRLDVTSVISSVVPLRRHLLAERL